MLMNELLSLLLSLLRNQLPQYTEIYPSFDAVPVSSKSRKLFLVVSPQCFRLSQAFPDGSAGIAPFTADFRISLLAPLMTPNDKLLEFFYTSLVPALHSANCFLYEMQSDVPKPDLQLQKLVYSASFRIKGLYLPDSQQEVVS